jgi:hypothetical protein
MTKGPGPFGISPFGIVLDHPGGSGMLAAMGARQRLLVLTGVAGLWMLIVAGCGSGSGVPVVPGQGHADATGRPASSAAGELKVGDLAPEFSLPGSDGQTYVLSNYKGRQVVVLAWFTKAFTDP